MKSRKRMNRRSSRKNFRRNAAPHPKNLPRKIMRGGYRL